MTLEQQHQPARRLPAIAAAVLLGVSVGVTAVCGGRVIREIFGERAASLTWILACLGAAASLTRARTRGTPRQLLVPALVLLGAGVAALPLLMRGAYGVGSALELTGFSGAAAFVIPVALWSGGLASAGAALQRTTRAVWGVGLLGAALGCALALFVWRPVGTTPLLWGAGGALVLGALCTRAAMPAKDAETKASSAPTSQALLLLATAVFAVLVMRGWRQLVGAMVGTHLVSLTLLQSILWASVGTGVLVGLWFLRRGRTPHLWIPLSLGAVAAVWSGAALQMLPTYLLKAETFTTPLVWTLLAGVGPTGLCLGAIAAVSAAPGIHRLSSLAWGLGLGGLIELALGSSGFATSGAIVVAAGCWAMLAVVARLSTPGKRRALWAVVAGLPLVAMALPALRTALQISWISPAVALRSPRPQGLTLRTDEDVQAYLQWFGGRRADSVTKYEKASVRYWVVRTNGDAFLQNGHLRAHKATHPSEVAAALIGVLCRPRARYALVGAHGHGHEEGVLIASHLSVTVAQDEVLDHCTPNTYDVIVAKPGPLWLPSVGRLATAHGWTRVRESLTPKGIFVQPMRHAPPALVAQFRAVFADVWMLRFDETDLLVGSNAPIEVNAAHWDRILLIEGVQTLASAVGLGTPGAIWKHLFANTKSLDTALRDVVLQDAPNLELDAAWLRMQPKRTDFAARTLPNAFPPDFSQFDKQTIAPWMRDALVLWTQQRRFDKAQAWERAWPYGEHTETLASRAEIALARNEFGTAGRMAATLVERGIKGPALRTAVRAMVGSANGAPPREARATRASAVNGLEALAQRSKNRGADLAAIAGGMASVGPAARAQELFEEALAVTGAQQAPAGTRAAFAKLLLSGGLGVDAEKRAGSLLRSDPATNDDPDLLNLLVREASLEADPEAATMEKALESLSRMRALDQTKIAHAALLEGNWPAAARAAREAATIYPRDPDAWLALLFASKAILADARTSDAARTQARMDIALLKAHLNTAHLDTAHLDTADLSTADKESGAPAQIRRIEGWFPKIDSGAVQPPR